MTERLDDYRQCLNWAEQAVYNLHGSFANHDPNMEELLTALGVGHYILGETAEVEMVLETPMMREDYDARFTLLTSLMREGDQSLTLQARQAMSRASEENIYLDDVVPGLDFGGIRSAVQLARLVSVGDNDLVDIARKAAGGVDIKHRSTQFARLYCAGDQQSLNLTCKAAELAYEEDELTGYDHNSWIATSNLHAVIDHALKNEAFQDAADVTKFFKYDSDITEALAKRFAAGDISVLEELEERLPDEGRIRRRCITHLAKAGYEPAVQEIKDHLQRTEKSLFGSKLLQPFRFREGYSDRYELYEDLTILHGLGDETAIVNAVRLARIDKEFSSAHGFGNEGEGVKELAKIAYGNNPGVLTRIRLLELDFSPELFKDQLIDEVGRLQDSQFSWLSQLIILTARKAKSISASE